jgi:D-amino peptidase
VAFLGQHARANRSPAVMAHTYSSLGIQKMTLNGKEVGEIETRTALAGWYGVPVIFLSGDQAAAEDLKAIVPDAETAVVKEAMGYYACMSMSAPEAQALIEKKARESMAKIGKIRPYKIDGPVNLDIEFTTRSTLSPQTSYPPGVERVGPRAIRYSGKDFMEAWTHYAGR